MRLKRCEPRQICNETLLLVRLITFFLLTRYFGDTHDLMFKNRTCLFKYLVHWFLDAPLKNVD